MHARTLAVVIALVSILIARISSATEIRTLDHATWDEAVRTLQHDVASEGRVVRVEVDDDQHQAIPCGRYVLRLDAFGAAAFQIGACDEQTRATAIVLAHRAALFVLSDPVPLPLEIELRATVTQDAVALGGGGPTGGRELRCVASVQPYLQDLLHGTRVALTPDRYLLRTLSTEVHADPTDAGWTLSGPQSASARVEYEIVDVARNERVLHDETTLQCSDVPVGIDAIATHSIGAIGVVHSATDRTEARRRMATVVAPIVGPSIAGTVFLTVGIALHNESPTLSTVYEVVGPVLLSVSTGALIAGLVQYVRTNRRNHAAANSPQFMALSIAPSESGSGAMAAATWRF